MQSAKSVQKDGEGRHNLIEKKSRPENEMAAIMEQRRELKRVKKARKKERKGNELKAKLIPA